MSKKRNSKKTSENNTAVMDATKVRIANGAGRKPTILDFKQGETYAQLFARAGIEPGSDQTVTTGKKVVKNFEGLVEAGSTITIANKPNNGS